jgi:hypothetical protein
MTMAVRRCGRKVQKEQLVLDSERQLPGKVVNEEMHRGLEWSQNMTAEQLLHINATTTLPETSQDKEMQRRVIVINTVTVHV